MNNFIFHWKSISERLNISKETLKKFEEDGMEVNGRGKAKRYDEEIVRNWQEQKRAKISELKIGAVYKKSEIGEVFKCTDQGGMLRAHSTNTLVLFSSHVGNDYKDQWIIDDNKDNILLYVGMGQRDKGDQKLEGNQNITLKESGSNGVDVYLFETFEHAKHTFRGKVELAYEPYIEHQSDRDVWIFPLKIVNEDLILTENFIKNIEDFKQEKAKKMSMDVLFEKAKDVRGKSIRTVRSNIYERDPYVAEYTKRRADGKCDLCGELAPFKDKKGQPYLENHHVKWLSQGGEDTIFNTVALDPTCHKKIHVLNDSEDTKQLIEKLNFYQERGL